MGTAGPFRLVLDGGCDGDQETRVTASGIEAAHAKTRHYVCLGSEADDER